MNERFKRSMERLRPHGTRTRYHQGCRCLLCRVACAEYQKRLNARKRAGLPSRTFVSVDPVRAHLLELSAAGVGLGVVAQITGYARSNIARIRSGRQSVVRAEKATAILSVTKEARIDGTLVSAIRTRQMARVLQSEGFTYEQIAKRAGVSRRAFIPRKQNVLARTEMRVEQFYNRVMAEEKAA